MVDGVLNIDKPAGMTSHDVVARVRRLAKQKQVGHAGTLDPDATGVLLVCLGLATRLSDYLAEQGKRYRAVLALGATTSTEDASGEILTRQSAEHVREEDLRAILPRFIGEISQVPPMVSAVHHEGRRLYELARQGIEVERDARMIHVDALELTQWQPGVIARATLDVQCGKGTYVRTLCADIGAALEVGGHMGSLCRLGVGRFDVETAVPLADLTPEMLPLRLVSPSDAIDWMPEFRVSTEEEMVSIRHGRALSVSLPDMEMTRVVNPNGSLAALAKVVDGRLLPFKVFHDGAQ